MKLFFKFINKFKLDIIFIMCLNIWVFGLVDKELDNDTFFTIPTGNYIMENGVNEIEPFTFHENLKFIKLRWGFDVIIAIIYKYFNFDGVYIFVIAISMLISNILYFNLSKRNNVKLLSFLITIAVMYGISNNLKCRAQIISYLLFSIEMYLLEKLVGTQKRKYIILLSIISILLVNFHSSVWLVFFLPFFPYFVEKMLYKLKEKFKFINKFEIKDFPIKNIFIAFVICFFTGLISPLGLNPYTYIFKVMGGISKEFISELQPSELITTFPLNYIISGLILLLLFTKTKIRISDFFIILGFTIMGKLAIRNLYISIIFISYPITRIIVSCISDYDVKKIFDNIENTIQNKFLATFILVIVVIYYTNINYHTFNYSKYVSEYKYPVLATEYFLKNEDISTARVFTEFNYGSYLELHGIKVFVDSRSEVFCKEFSNCTILEDWYKTAYEDPNNILELIKKYNITHLVVYTESEYVTVLNNQRDCNLVYSDENFSIYKKVK